MPTSITCQRGHQFEFDKTIDGQTVQCPTCGESVVVPDQTDDVSGEEADTNDNAPVAVSSPESPVVASKSVELQKTITSKEQKSLKLVSIGIQLILASIAIMALVAIAIFALPNYAPAISATVILHLPKIMVGVISLSMLGKVLCLWVPTRSDAKIFITITVLFELPGFFVNMLLLTAPLQLLRMPWLVLNWPLSTALAAVCFILFLRSLAVFLHRNDLAKKSVILLVVCFALTGFVFALMNRFVPIESTDTLMLIGLGLLVFGVVILLFYIRILSNLRTAIRDLKNHVVERPEEVTQPMNRVLAIGLASVSASAVIGFGFLLYYLFVINPPEETDFAFNRSSSDFGSPTAESETSWEPSNDYTPPTPLEEIAVHDEISTTPIEPDIQRKLKLYGDERIPAQIELLKHTHAEVRRQAVENLSNAEEGELSDVIPALRAALKDGHSKVRAEAADSLAAYGIQAKDALPDLLEIIKSDDKVVYNSALVAIGNMGAEAETAVPRLLEILNDDSSRNREHVVYALGEIGPASKDAVPKLVEFMNSYNLSTESAVALGQIGAVDELVAGMQSNNSSTRTSAAEGAKELAEHPESVVNALIKMLTEDKDQFPKGEAAVTLGHVRPTTEAIVKALGTGSTDEQSWVRQRAVESLGKIDPQLDSAVPLLVAATKDADAWTRQNASRALGKFKISPKVRFGAILDQIVKTGRILYTEEQTAIKEGAEEFVPLLWELAKDKSVDDVKRAIAFRSFAAMIYNRELFSEEDQKNYVQLCEDVANDNESPVTVRAAGAVYLADRGNKSPALETVMIEGLKAGKLIEVRRQCAYKLGHRKSETAVPVLVAAMTDDEDVINSAISALKSIGPAAAPAIPTLIECAKNPEFSERGDAILAIGEIQASVVECIPVVHELMKDEDVAIAAAKSLAMLLANSKADAGPYLGDFTDLISKVDDFSINRVVQAIAILGEKAEPVVPEVTKLLTHEKDFVRRAAAQSLGDIGPTAKGAAPALVTAAKTWEKPRPAIIAIGKIQAGGKEFAEAAPELLKNLDNLSDILKTLGELGEDSKPAVAAIATILESPKEYERTMAIDTLVKIGEAANAAIPKLKELAADESSTYIAKRASKALMIIAPNDPEVLEVVFKDVAAMGNRDLRQFGEQLGDRLPQIIKAGLASKETTSRQAAIRLVSSLEDGEQWADSIEPALDDEDEEVRVAAALKLHELGRFSDKQLGILIGSLKPDSWEISRAIRNAGRRAIPALVDTFFNEQKPIETRRAVKNVLRGYQRETRQLIPRLKEAMASDNKESQFLAAVFLPYCDPENLDAVPILLQMVKSEESVIRKEAIETLGRIEFDNDNRFPDEIAAVMLEGLKSDDETLAKRIADTISYHKLSDKNLPSILSFLGDDEKQKYAVRALSNGSITSNELIEPLVAALKGDDNTLSQQAASALVHQGELATVALIDVFANSELSEDTRKFAAIALADLEPTNDDDKKQKVVQQLTSDNPKITSWASVVLARWKHDWTEVEPHILKAIVDDNSDLQNRAQRALFARAEDAKNAVSGLVKLAEESSDGNKTRLIANVLGRVGKDSPEAAEALAKLVLRQKTSYERRSVARALWECGDVSHKAFLNVAKDSEPETLANLIATLGSFDGESPEIVKLVQTGLESSDPTVVNQAAITLTYLDSKSDDPVEHLIALLDSDGDRMNEALGALQRLGPKAKPAIPKLIELLNAEEIPRGAVEALGAIGPDAAPAAARIAELLNHENFRWPAIRALGDIGTAAKDAAPALIKLLSNDQTMSEAARALGKINPSDVDAVAVLRPMLTDPYMRYQAVQTIGQLGELGKSGVPILLAGLQKSDTELQVVCAHALGRLGEVASESVPQLVPHLKAEDASVRASATYALGAIHSNASISIPALIGVLDDAETRVRRSACSAISAFGEEGAPAVERLTELLDDKELTTSSIGTLGAIGPPAIPALPHLTRLLESEDTYIQSVAKEAIDKINAPKSSN